MSTPTVPPPPNTSNFTYRESPIQTTTQQRPYISQLPIQVGNPLYANNITNANISTEYRPLTINVQTGDHVSHYQKNVSIGSRVIGSRLVEARPVSTIAAGPSQLLMQPGVIQRPITTTTTNTQVVNVQPVQRVETMYSRPSIPISTIIQGTQQQYRPLPVPQQQILIQETRPVPVAAPAPTVQTQIINQPQQHLQPIIKYEYQQEPLVQTARNSTWASHYESKKAAAQPPPAAPKEKGGCNPALCAILGLLALGGLIAGIVLALKARGGYGDGGAGISQTPGTGGPVVLPEESQYSNYTITVETTVVNTTASTTKTNSTNSTANNTNNTSQQVSTQIITQDPITVKPNVTMIAPVVPEIVTFDAATTIANNNTSLSTSTTNANSTSTATTTSTTVNQPSISTTPTISQPVYDGQTSGPSTASTTSTTTTTASGTSPTNSTTSTFSTTAGEPVVYSVAPTPTAPNSISTSSSTTTTAPTNSTTTSTTTTTSVSSTTTPTSTPSTTTTTTVTDSTAPSSPVFTSDSTTAFSAIRTTNTTTQPIITPMPVHRMEGKRHRIGLRNMDMDN